MRICLYSETALPKVGGQELVVDHLARQFVAKGHEVTLLAPHPGRGFVCQDASLPYRVVRHPRFFSTRRFVRFYARYLRRLFVSWPFDVLHCHSVYPGGYLASLCGGALPVPYVVTSHGGDVREGNCRLQKPGLAERHAAGIAGASALIAISRFTEEGFSRLCPGLRLPIHRIPNGVSYADFQRPASPPPSLAELPPAKDFLAFLGRLHPRKGVDILLHAMVRLPAPERIPLVIAGDGPARADLQEQARSLGLTPWVRFVGMVQAEAKVCLLQQARAVVLPSRQWEAFPLVVLEAFAAGTPVIGTQIPGLGDLIVPNETGFSVAPEDPTALVGALARVCQNRAECQTMGMQARKFAADFSWQNVADQHLELYAALSGKTRQLVAG